MRSAHLQQVAALVAVRTGITFQASSNGRLTSAMHEEAASRAVSPEALITLLEHDPVVFQSLLDRVTIQESSFFRDPAQFEALSSILETTTEPVTIWSAGCANGQEAYSLAMTLDASPLEDWRVLATDISTRALTRTTSGRYSEREVRGIPSDLLDRYMTRREGAMEVVPSLRSRVTVLRHNLVSDPPPFASGSCSIVFCRNVLIYLHRTEVIRFLDRVHDRLPSDGLLFLGFSESLWTINDRFRLLRVGDAFVYRRADMHAGDGSPSTVREPSEAARFSPVDPERAPDGSSDVDDRFASGVAAAERGDHAAAAAAFRQAAYLDPAHVLAHYHLGLCLEALGDEQSAFRAFRAASAAIRGGTTGRVDAGLEGFGPRGIVDEIRSKLETGGR